MKILVVNTFYYPNIVGGAENSVQLLAENLCKKNHEVAVFSIDVFSNEMIIEETNGIKIYRGTGKKFNTKLRYNKEGSLIKKLKNKFVELYNKSITEEIQKVLEDFKPEVIHTNNLYGISPIIWKIAKEYNIPCVHTVRDYWILNPKNDLQISKNIVNTLYQKHFRKYSKYVHFVTAPSKLTLDSVLDYGYFEKENSEIVYNSVNIDMEHTNKCIEKRRKEDGKQINFMFVGSLFENKGIYNLINAFSSVNNENIRLTICGKGKLEEYVRESCKKDVRIKYAGMLNKEELQKEWLKNDVLIVPSIWEEPFGRVVIEANQNGLPVIGSNRGGIQETIDHIHTGITYQYDSIEELTKAIWYFSDRNNIKKYYDAIIDNIEEYSIEKQIESFSKIYRKITSKEGVKDV